MACAGECMTPLDAEDYMSNESFDIETYCPMYDCDGYGADSPNCLGEDVLDTLVKNNGVAPGAKLAIFDDSQDEGWGYGDLAGNFLWNSTFGTGTKIHSNSWGFYGFCESTEFDFLYDTFMSEVGTKFATSFAGRCSPLDTKEELARRDTRVVCLRRCYIFHTTFSPFSRVNSRFQVRRRNDRIELSINHLSFFYPGDHWKNPNSSDLLHVTCQLCTYYYIL